MKIAVCCSSTNDIDDIYKESSKELLNEVFKQDNDLVFGAANRGIMGIAYRIAKQNNRKVIGLATKLYEEELYNLECDTEVVEEIVNSRTNKLIEMSDVLLFLPGGIGTLYELMTAIEMKRNNEFNKPIIIYNKTGFFDEAIKMLDKVYSENFTDAKVSLNYSIVNSCKEIMDLLHNIHTI